MESSQHELNLLRACLQNNIDAVDCLLRERIDPNCIDKVLNCVDMFTFYYTHLIVVLSRSMEGLHRFLRRVRVT